MGKGHARNEDVYLNKNGGNEVTAANLKDAVDKKHLSANQFNPGTTGEIAGLTEKTTPVGQDITLIEDSESSNAKKKVKIENLLQVGFSKVRAYQSVAQSIPLNTWTKINFQTEQYDALGEFDTGTSRFTALYPGYYMVTLGAYGPSLAGNIAIFKTSASECNTYISLYPWWVSTLVYLDVGNFIEGWIFFTPAATLQADSTKTFISISRVI